LLKGPKFTLLSVFFARSIVVRTVLAAALVSAVCGVLSCGVGAGGGRFGAGSGVAVGAAGWSGLV